MQAPIDMQPTPRAVGQPAVIPPPPQALRSDMTLRGLLDAHYLSIWRLLRRFGVPEDHADDAAQEVFWVAARRLSDIRAGSEASFLYGIAIRIAARVRRDREPPIDGVEALDGVSDGRPSIEDMVDERRARALLDQVLDAMQDDLREVFVLFELEEIEIPYIAEILGIPLGTVGSRLRRARQEFSAIAKRVRAQMEFRGGLR